MQSNKNYLPYTILITRIKHLFSVNLTVEACVHLGWWHFFRQKNTAQIEYLYIFQVSGVW